MTKKACFVISPIGEEATDERALADKVLKYIVQPSVLQRGYEAVRADGIDKPGLITAQVIQRVTQDDLVVADLTDHNPNVFYELALRHATGKPFIQLISKGQRIPFDIAQQRTIFYDVRDLDSVESAKLQILKQIDEIESNPSASENPLGMALDLQKLSRSDDPTDRDLYVLIEEIGNLKTLISSLQESNPTADGRQLRKIISDAAFRGASRMEAINLSKEVEESKHRLDLAKACVSVGEKIAYAVASFSIIAPWIYEYGMRLSAATWGEVYFQTDHESEFKALKDLIEKFKAMKSEVEIITDDYDQICDLAISMIKEAEIPF